MSASESRPGSPSAWSASAVTRAEDLLAAEWARTEAEASELRDAEVVDRVLADWGQVSIEDRLAELVGSQVTLTVMVVGPVEGQLLGAGNGWVTVCAPGRRLVVGTRFIIRFDAPRGSRPSPRSAATVVPDLKAVSRSLLLDRRRVDVVLSDGSRLAGVITRVGRDHLDLAPPVGPEGRWEPGDGGGSGGHVIATASLVTIAYR